MKTRKFAKEWTVAAIAGVLMAGGSAWADDPVTPGDRLDNRGDRIEDRLDDRGDRIDDRLDNRGDRILSLIHI